MANCSAGNCNCECGGEKGCGCIASSDFPDDCQCHCYGAVIGGGLTLGLNAFVALWPERVRGLVTANSYNIQDIPNSGRPASPEQEHRLWYQYYFSTERGRAGLEANRKAFCRLLWKLWSP